METEIWYAPFHGVSVYAESYRGKISVLSRLDAEIRIVLRLSYRGRANLSRTCSEASSPRKDREIDRNITRTRVSQVALSKHQYSRRIRKIAKLVGAQCVGCKVVVNYKRLYRRVFQVYYRDISYSLQKTFIKIWILIVEKSQALQRFRVEGKRVKSKTDTSSLHIVVVREKLYSA